MEVGVCSSKQQFSRIEPRIGHPALEFQWAFGQAWGHSPVHCRSPLSFLHNLDIRRNYWLGQAGSRSLQVESFRLAGPSVELTNDLKPSPPARLNLVL